MKKVITTESLICDCCGKVMDAPTTNGENMSHVLISLRYDVWYGGTFYIEDICEECNIKLFTFLSNNKMMSNAVKE